MTWFGQSNPYAGQMFPLPIQLEDIPYELKHGHYFSMLRETNNYVSLKMNTVMELNF